MSIIHFFIKRKGKGHKKGFDCHINKIIKMAFIINALDAGVAKPGQRRRT